jgi:hypothetical protein
VNRNDKLIPYSISPNPITKTMNPKYTNRQQRIYSDYSPKSDSRLLVILQNKKDYIPEVIEIIIDILDERGSLPEHIAEENRILAKENSLKLENENLINYASNLLYNQNKSPEESVQILVSKGIETIYAQTLINKLLLQGSEFKKKAVNNDILYGALWCIGGIILTAADVGYIFWGAIVFGGFQLIRGLINS